MKQTQDLLSDSMKKLLLLDGQTLWSCDSGLYALANEVKANYACTRGVASFTHFWKCQELGISWKEMQ